MTAPVLTGTVLPVEDVDSSVQVWVDAGAFVRVVAVIGTVAAVPLTVLVVVGPVAAVLSGLAALAVAFLVGKVVQWTVWAAKTRRADRAVHADATPQAQRSSHTGRLVEQEEKVSA